LERQVQGCRSETYARPIATQRGDGGWADIDTTPSTAFATGRALVALETAGLPVFDEAY
jgi:hypothetical protein